MSKIKDSIVYPGSEQYSDQALNAPGSIRLDLGSEPLCKAIDTAYILFEVPSLDKQLAFLNDFGMLEAQHEENVIYMRGYGTSPYFYVAYKGKQACFLGAGFLVESEDDLKRIAQLKGKNIEDVDGPGGGRRVRLHDPDGFIVDLVWGREEVSPIETRREPLPLNLPNIKSRINRTQRPSLAPSPVERFGHYVLMVNDFQTSWRWYRNTLGLIPSDVQCTESGIPVLAFCRLDIGAKPSDHHTLVLAGGTEPKYMHSAYETLDIDTIGQGQQFLKQKGWQHFWGIGRHILGSQLFDYWLDPNGFELEHYADGDVFDNQSPAQYHLIDRGGLWAWGDDVPAAMKVKPRLKDLIRLFTEKPEWRKLMMEMKKAMSRAPRPWLK